jgi:RNA methyltransferase, TrmH family
MARAETITSTANPLIKDVRRAIARGTLTDQGWCVAETFHLLEEAIRSRCEVKIVLSSESAHPETQDLLDRSNAAVKLAVLPDTLFQSIAGTQTTQGVIALVSPPEWKVEDLFCGEPLLVVLDALQDPGNAGTIARAAEAFGATGMLFLKGTVSPWNPKVLRAAAGSLFRVPFLHSVDADFALATLRQHETGILAGMPAAVSAVRPLTSIDLTRPTALIIGSEAHGVREELRSAAVSVAIPTTGVESLNAALAAGILLYEVRRQRTLRP